MFIISISTLVLSNFKTILMKSFALWNIFSEKQITTKQNKQKLNQTKPKYQPTNQGIDDSGVKCQKSSQTQKLIRFYLFKSTIL